VEDGVTREKITLAKTDGTHYSGTWSNGRPQATITITSATTLSAYFPDDKTYTGTITDVNTITFVNGPWFRYVAPDLSGRWGNSGEITLAKTDGSHYSGTWSNGRPQATITITGPNSLSAYFPDDKTYTATFTDGNTITYTNGPWWRYVAPDLSGRWGNSGEITLAKTDGSHYSGTWSNGRPQATITITGPTALSAYFPDDSTYTGAITDANTITFNNGPWKRFAS